MKRLEDVHNEHRPSTVSFTWAEYMRFLHVWEMREKKLNEDIRLLEQKIEQLREDAKTLTTVIDDRLGRSEADDGRN